ncbi:MAG: glycosyltransferase family 4 protein [Deltaproteobacteria bacterium]|nr:glycosyltransferase family 4 protein [Deltaproteobacteria bacterium]
MILKGYPRISETFISNEILLLEEQGLSLHILSMRQPREAFSHASVGRIKAAVDYLPETLLTSLPALLPQNLMLAIKQPRRFAAALRVAFRRFLRTQKSATFKHLFQAGYLVNKFLPGSNITHFHAHFAHSPTSVAFFTSLLSGIPFSFTAHAKDIYTTDPAQLREKMAHAAFVVTCTEYNRRYLTRLSGMDAPAVFRVYHGIDIGLFSGHHDRALPLPPYRILTVSRMTAKKGLPTVFKALGMLRDRGIRFHHTLIGDGDERDSLKKLVRDLGLEPFVRWMGTQPHDEVIAQYRHADLFVLGCEIAANGDRDGIPNVCVESMAMGVPVVATRISAIPELIENIKTGLLVDPGNPEALAKAMVQALTDGDLRQKMITAARDRVSRDFNNRNLIGTLADLYTRALREKSAKPI